MFSPRTLDRLAMLFSKMSMLFALKCGPIDVGNGVVHEPVVKLCDHWLPAVDFDGAIDVDRNASMCHCVEAFAYCNDSGSAVIHGTVVVVVPTRCAGMPPGEEPMICIAPRIDAAP